MNKPHTLLAILLIIVSSVSSFHIMAQIINAKDELNFLYARNIKSMDEFMARFNGEEFHPDVPDNENKHRNTILSLINRDMNRKGLSEDDFLDMINAFADSASTWNGKLFIDSTDLWTEVKCRFMYQHRAVTVTFILRKETNGSGQERWGISGVRGLKESKIYSDKLINISPADHEIGFMTFDDYFNHNNSKAAGFRTSDRYIDEFSLLVGLLMSEKIKFDSVTSIKYHFLDLPGFIFTVTNSTSADDMGGWQITDIIPAGSFNKLEFINLLFGHN